MHGLGGIMGDMGPPCDKAHSDINWFESEATVTRNTDTVYSDHGSTAPLDISHTLVHSDYHLI